MEMKNTVVVVVGVKGFLGRKRKRNIEATFCEKEKEIFFTAKLPNQEF